MKKWRLLKWPRSLHSSRMYNLDQPELQLPVLMWTGSAYGLWKDSMLSTCVMQKYSKMDISGELFWIWRWFGILSYVGLTTGKFINDSSTDFWDKDNTNINPRLFTRTGEATLLKRKTNIAQRKKKKKQSKVPPCVLLGEKLKKQGFFTEDLTGGRYGTS